MKEFALTAHLRNNYEDVSATLGTGPSAKTIRGNFFNTNIIRESIHRSVLTSKQLYFLISLHPISHTCARRDTAFI